MNAKKKLFLSHASEDKEPFVRLLAEKLSTVFNLWYDEYSLLPGMRLLDSINKGLAEADYGVVVFSQAYFEKKWTMAELGGLYSREEATGTIIIPVWKDLKAEEVRQRYPIFADRVAITKTDDVNLIVDRISESVEYFEKGKKITVTRPGIRRLTAVIDESVRNSRMRLILDSEKGVALGSHFAKETCEAVKRIAEKIKEETTETQIWFREGKNTWSEISCRLDYKNHSLFFNYFNSCTNSALGKPMEVSIFRDDEARSLQPKFTKISSKQYCLYVEESNTACWKTDEGVILTAEDLVEVWFGNLADIVASATEKTSRAR